MSRRYATRRHVKRDATGQGPGFRRSKVEVYARRLALQHRVSLGAGQQSNADGVTQSVNTGLLNGTQEGISPTCGLTDPQFLNETHDAPAREPHAGSKRRIPRSISDKPSKVSNLAQHFEQLSREFEQERLRERHNNRYKQTRSDSFASPKPVVENYKEVYNTSDEDPCVGNSSFEPERSRYSLATVRMKFNEEGTNEGVETKSDEHNSGSRASLPIKGAGILSVQQKGSSEKRQGSTRSHQRTQEQRWPNFDTTKGSVDPVGYEYGPAKGVSQLSRSESMRPVVPSPYPDARLKRIHTQNLTTYSSPMRIERTISVDETGNENIYKKRKLLALSCLRKDQISSFGDYNPDSSPNVTRKGRPLEHMNLVKHFPRSVDSNFSSLRSTRVKSATQTLKERQSNLYYDNEDAILRSPARENITVNAKSSPSPPLNITQPVFLSPPRVYNVNSPSSRGLSGFWRCSLCDPIPNANDGNTVYYNDFNRKDLFTQHLRRMHAAPKGLRKASRRTLPTQGDSVLLREMALNLPEITQKGTKRALDSAFDEAYITG